MNNFLKRCFSNNGVARGLLYVGISILTTLAAAFAVWQTTPPPNSYAIFAVLFKALADAGLTLRAYIDQHLSNTKNANPSQQPKI